MEGDDSDIEKFVEEMQDTTESCDILISSKNTPVLDDEAPASTATNGATSVDDSMVSSKDDSRFFEAEPDADLYDMPDRDIFDKFPNNDEDRESHDIATSSFSDGYKCFWR